jgi:hypothetical protein
MANIESKANSKQHSRKSKQQTDKIKWQTA